MRNMAETRGGGQDLLSLLPDEIRTLIHLLLTPHDLCSLALVCRTWYAHVQNSGAWLGMCRSRGFLLAGGDAEHKPGRYYKDLYIRLSPRLCELEKSIIPVKIATSVKRFRGVSYNDGIITAICQKGKVQQWDATSGQRLFSFHVRSDPTGFKVDKDVIVLGYKDGPIETWNIRSGTLLREYTGHEGRVEGIDVSIAHDRMLFASGDRHIRLWSVSKGNLLHVFTDTNTDFRFLGAGLYFPPKVEEGTEGQRVYFVLWATSHQISVTKLSSKNDKVLGTETLDLKVSVEYCQGMKVIQNALCSLICLQDVPNYFITKRLCLDATGRESSRCFVGEIEKFYCSHTAYISSFTCGTTYQVCFPLTLDRDRERPTGFPPLYDSIYIYRLPRPLVGEPRTQDMVLENGLQVRELQIHKPESSLVEKVKRLAARGTTRGTRSKVTFADLGDRKWLDGLDGTNDTGPFLVAVEFWEDPPRFELMVYNWAVPKSTM